MTRRVAGVLVVGLLAGCGGGGSSPTAPTPPTPSGSPSKVVVLGSTNFDAQVLATPRPSLVEFLSPT